ncbi:MAG: DUF4115 domain-containing protein [Anaerolineales bacterium]|nr:DUF4115 domain-containing protein [Anaerolineales bacterium]MBX3004967.1 DUF4115 domain-containing protein [Anaerolineales bacterium]
MTPQTVGHALSQQRQQRGLTLEQASEATHIRRHYLQALEAGDFGALPSAAQVRGFLRAYASYLDLDGEALLAQLRQPSASDPAPAAGAPPAAAQPTRPAPEPAAARAEPAPPAASGDFAHIAEQLRGRREQVQLTLAEVEQNTHIPEHYLRRLEAGDYDSFPSPTQARGMLGNYAEFLGLESEALLLQYAEVLQARFQQRAAEQAAKTKPAKPKPARPSLPPLKFRLPEWAQPLLTRDIAFGALMGLVLLTFITFSISRVLSTRANQSIEPTAPPLGSLGLPSATPDLGAVASGNESINLLGSPTATLTPGMLGQATVQANAGNINLRLLATQRVWMRVTVDGQIQFEGRTVPGQNYSYSANGQIVVLTGNAAGLRAFFNEQDLGSIGLLGEVSSVVFSAEGAVTPTPSPTPTTDPAQLTATAQATPSPTPTETPDAP